MDKSIGYVVVAGGDHPAKTRRRFATQLDCVGFAVDPQAERGRTPSGCGRGKADDHRACLAGQKSASTAGVSCQGEVGTVHFGDRSGSHVQGRGSGVVDRLRRQDPWRPNWRHRPADHVSGQRATGRLSLPESDRAEHGVRGAGGVEAEHQIEAGHRSGSVGGKIPDLHLTGLHVLTVASQTDP